MNLFINTEDANSTKIWLPLKNVFLYGNLRAYYAMLALLLLTSGFKLFARLSIQLTFE